MRWLLRMLFGCSLFLAVAEPAVCGELVTHTIASEKLAENQVGLNTTREFKVFLPDGYADSQKDYPVVYWFPGGGQALGANIRTDEIDAEFSSGRADESIVVFMDTMTEFGTTLFLSSEVFGDWEGHLTEEVIPFIDSNYRTQATPDKRGTMGFSMGGFSSVLFPIFTPNTFGAVGANDPSVSFTAGSVRNSNEVPPGYEPPTNPTTLEEFFDRFPETVQGYGDTTTGTSAFGQLAVTLTPNPDEPLLGNIPYTREGRWIPDVREAWRVYDLLNPDSVAIHEDNYKQLSTVSITHPETAVNTNMPWNREMLRVFDEAGIATNDIDFEGDHNDFQHERFIALLSDVSYALKGVDSESLNINVYTQDFDSLGTVDLDGSQPSQLPAGWSVATNSNGVFRDRTNTPFNGGNATIVGKGPHILNVGNAESTDRGLAVYLNDEADTATVQFEVDISELNANAIQLKFDAEAWDQLGDAAGESSTLGFRVAAEFDFGDGYEEMIDFGEFQFGESITLPATDFVDGELEANRAQFEALGGAPTADATSMRLLFTADASVSTPGWIQAIDDVELDFSFRGDFDGDSILTARDIDLLTSAMRNNPVLEFDLTEDGDVDFEDLDFWVSDLYGTKFGDTDLNFVVNFADFLLFSRNFGTNTAQWEAGDFDGDAEVGFSDFLLFSRSFGVTVETATVPEPSSQASIVFIIAVCLQVRRRRSN